MKIKLLFLTIKQLGLKDCWDVFLHRIFIKFKVYKIFFPSERKIITQTKLIHEKLYFKPLLNFQNYSSKNYLAEANDLLKFKFKIFNKTKKLNKYIDWYSNPFDNKQYDQGLKHWSEYKHFSNYDIKNVWELSRWHWAPVLARAWRYSGNFEYLNLMNKLMKNWNMNNSYNLGLNWNCAQEVSIRLIHALQAWYIADSDDFIPSEILENRILFVKDHLRRICQTLIYSKAQKNNHYLSESAALYIGSIWLRNTFYSDKERIKKWEFLGLKGLNFCVKKLIFTDGSFSQHSINYHRYLLDVLTQVEFFRRLYKKQEFSVNFYRKCKLATIWLITMVDEISGDASNIGHNDGTNCFKLCSSEYRDFKPTIQLASNLFLDQAYYPNGKYDEPIFWLNLEFKKINKNNKLNKKKIISNFFDGGYSVFKPVRKSWAILRLPNYKFRPAQIDPFHFDLWHKGINILRDGGTFSYNSKMQDLKYFTGVASHNTLQFDDLEQMQRISRFLFLNNIKQVKPVRFGFDNKEYFFCSAYKFKNGFHERLIKFNSKGDYWSIEDKVSNFIEYAILRWRLVQSDWKKLNSRTFKSKLATLIISSDSSKFESKIINGLESRYYSSKNNLPVIEYKVDKKCWIKTDIYLN